MNNSRSCKAYDPCGATTAVNCNPKPETCEIIPYYQECDPCGCPDSACGNPCCCTPLRKKYDKNRCVRICETVGDDTTPWIYISLADGNTDNPIVGLAKNTPTWERTTLCAVIRKANAQYVGGTGISVVYDAVANTQTISLT